MSEDIERVNYYQLEYLGAEDFQAEQGYHRDMRRRHNVGHHLLGIVIGLEITEVAKGSGAGYDTYVQPGLAIDGFGREIVVFAPYKLDATDFSSFSGTQTHEVWIAYREQLDTPPAAGYAQCVGEDQNKRVREDFRIVIDPPSPKHPAVVVGGKAAVLRSDPASATAPAVIPDDESVPYQDFPDDTVRWLVRLGSATWNATQGVFDVTPDAKRVEGRVYTGVIAEDVLSPSTKLLLRPRTFVAGHEDDADFAEVQGRLQVDGRIVAKKDVYLHGGRLSLQTTNGADDNVPLWLQRKPPSGLIGYDLRVDIGPAKGPQRLSIGTDGDDPAKTKAVLAVRADDNVDIATGNLNFGTTPLRQMLNLSGDNYGIGVQTATLYNRSVSAFAWYRGGIHDDTPAVSGPGGTMVMQLDPTNKLKVFGAIEATGLTAQTLQANDVFVDGGKIQLRLSDGTIDTDELSITRFRQGPNSNDLRVIIGDDATFGEDAFTVGPTPGGTYVTKFRVANTGDVLMKGDLTLDAGKFVNIGPVRLGGNFPVDVILISALLNVTNDTGVYPPLNQPPITIPSRMPSVSSASMTVVLQDINNLGVAVNASWYVYVSSLTWGGNQVSFRIGYQVTDTDGSIGFVSGILVMVP